jgi:hypothetical protein
MAISGPGREWGGAAGKKRDNGGVKRDYGGFGGGKIRRRAKWHKMDGERFCDTKMAQNRGAFQQRLNRL